MLAETEIEAPTNFCARTAQLAAKAARVPAKASVWDVVARIATRPIFGYPAWAVSAAVHLFALGGLTLVMVERAEDRKTENEAPKFAFKTPRGSTRGRWTSGSRCSLRRRVRDLPRRPPE